MTSYEPENEEYFKHKHWANADTLRYLIDCMKYLMKVDTCAILQNDFVIHNYHGFINDSQTVEEFKEVEISCKDKFMAKMIKNENPVAFNEKFKDMFSIFLLKSLNITGHNFMFVPINDEQYGSLGCILFANKNINKEKKNFDKRDERLATICMYLIKAYFKIEEAQLVTRTIENKNWKMSELVDKALMANSVKEFIYVVHTYAPDFYKVERVNIYMCDHRRQEIYQIIEDKEGTDILIFFSSQSGIAGKVSNEGKSFVANKIQDHHQFLQEIDDPKGKYHPVTGVPMKGEVNILTIPIFCYNEMMEPAFKYYPLCVIQLINKINELPFTEEEQRNSEKCSQFLGKILSFIIREDERKCINEKKRMSKVYIHKVY